MREGRTAERRNVPAAIALADGSVWRGTAFGHVPAAPVTGEVVFNTSLYGYQEILTDPSYAGQIMCFTNPHVGNVGCNPEDDESDRVHARGVVIRDLSRVVSNFRSTRSFSDYLDAAGVLGLAGVDTREIVTHVRSKGAQSGALAAGDSLDVDALVDAARSAGGMEGRDYVRDVRCAAPYVWEEGPWTPPGAARRKPGPGGDSFDRPHVVAVDCGVKRTMLRLLVGAGFRVSVVPAGTDAAGILSLGPDGVFLSNGPGDPATLGYVVGPTRELLGKVPVFGICLGHQVLSQAVGCSTYKLKFGHRGGNHPVKDHTTGKVEITVQNHGFAVDPAGLGGGAAALTHENLNDGTVEGLAVPGQRAFSVQYHPEASPGPHDAAYLFGRFYRAVTGSE